MKNKNWAVTKYEGTKKVWTKYFDTKEEAETLEKEEDKKCIGIEDIITFRNN